MFPEWSKGNTKCPKMWKNEPFTHSLFCLFHFFFENLVKIFKPSLLIQKDCCRLQGESVLQRLGSFIVKKGPHCFWVMPLHPSVYISVVTHLIPLKFCMKLRLHKYTKKTFLIFEKNFRDASVMVKKWLKMP